MKKITTKLLVIMGVANLYMPQLYADSEKVYFEANGHYYQRFDSRRTWRNAKLDCEDKKAHLATITSAAEENFVVQLIPGEGTGYYNIGGTDAAVQTKWQWVTGEKWGYQIWSQGGDNGPQPSDRIDEDYLIMGLNQPNTDVAWFDINSTVAEVGYICEWGFSTNIASAIVPDLNKNGSKELAVLSVAYPSGRHTVVITDSKSRKAINTLVFATNHEPPQGLAVVKDLNGNGSPEIAVLYVNKLQPAVFIKDAKAKPSDKLLKTINFFDKNYKPQTMAVSNGKGTDEITVLARHKQTQADVFQTRSSKTGALIQ